MHTTTELALDLAACLTRTEPDLGHLLRLVRRVARRSLPDVAARAGMPVTRLQLIETGRRSASEADLRRIVQVLLERGASTP